MKNHNGFTLFELMIAIAVISILSAIAVPAYQGYMQKAALTDMLQTMSPYKTAVEICMLENGSLNACNSGQHGIGQSKITRYISSVSVTSGRIEITGSNALNGLKVILRPGLTEGSGDLDWQRRCEVVSNDSLFSACNSVFRFNDMD